MSNRPTSSRHDTHHHEESEEFPLGDAGAIRRRSWAARALAAGSGLVGTVAGIAPHVFHHVAPIAGAVFLTGATGSIVFGVAGFILTIPMLLRLRRRFRTWVAPAIALVFFVAAFTLSTLVIGPAISGGSDPAPVAEEQLDPHGH